MKNNTLRNKNTIKRVLWIALLAALLFGNGQILLAQHSHEHEHEHHGGLRTPPPPPDTVTMNLSYGNIRFTDGNVTYYDRVGDNNVLQTEPRPEPENRVWKIIQNAGTTENTIWVGTPVTYTPASGGSYADTQETAGTPVTKNTIILLDNINIDITSSAHPLDEIPIMVNNATGSTVFLILKENTTNNVAIDISTSGTAYNNNHAAIEKELSSAVNDADGSLVITCETGYRNYNPATWTGGHNCSASGTCGKLNAYANLAKRNTYHSSAGAGGGAAAIGSIGSSITGDSREGGFNVRGGIYNPSALPGYEYTYYRHLKNLVIAGGVILAKGATNNTGIAVQYGGAGIGTGAGPLATTGTSPIGPDIENLCITGGHITTHGGTASAANLGGGYRSGHMVINIKGGYVDARERWRNGYESDYYNTYYGPYDQRDKAAGIGAGSGGRLSGSVGHATVNISGGVVYAQSRWGAAIGGGSGGIGVNDLYGYTFSSGATVNISCADPTNNPTEIHATTLGSGAAIGSGGLFADGEYTGDTGDATITITGSRSSVEVRASSTSGADIGTGGQINTRNYCNAGKAIVNIYGGEIYAETGGIGGGHAVGGKGGSAEVTISGTAHVTAASIGGGISQTNDGGSATVTVNKTGTNAPTITLTGGIGGGNSTDATADGNGGYAEVNVNGGTLTAGGAIGGGNAAGTGNGGQATVNVTDGFLRATSIGGGNATKSGGTGNGGQATVNVTGGTLVASNGASTPVYGAIGGGYAAGSGLGGNASVTINNGSSTITAASIGGGASTSGNGGEATVEVVAGTLNAYGNIGGGNSTSSEASGNGGEASVTVSGGHLYATGTIGGGSAAGSGNGGEATVNISVASSELRAMNIGGGASEGGNGGEATVTVNAGTLVASDGASTPTYGTIGGGNTNASSTEKHGGDATITIHGGSLTAETIGGGEATGDGSNGGRADIIMTGGEIHRAATGGGDATSGHGGFAFIDISGGSYQGGSIGGGDVTTGVAGDASIYITGGSLDCESIGGGDAWTTTGTPGSVVGTVQTNSAAPYYNPTGAGIYIVSSEEIHVTSGYIGGGKNTKTPEPDLGYATAYIDAPNATIQGQFVLTNTQSGRSCFFTMLNGTIDNSGLTGVLTGAYPRMQANGGAIYMTDTQSPTITLSGGTIKNCSGSTLGGAVYMNNGTFTMSGNAKIENCSTVTSGTGTWGLGGAVYMGGGTFTMNGGTIGSTAIATGNKAGVKGGGIYMDAGTFEMNDGSIKYNKATSEDGGGVYIGGTARFYGGTIQGNEAGQDGGGFYVNPGSGTTPINSSQHTTIISDNKAGRNGGGAYVASGQVEMKNITLDNNTATAGDGGGIWATSNVTVKSCSITNNKAFEGSDGKGGGIYTQGTNTVVVLDKDDGESDPTTLTGNKADKGGGVYTAATITDPDIDYAVELNHATLGSSGSGNANTATVDGGGVYARGPVNVSANASVEYNTAAQDGGGVYVGTGGSLDLSGAVSHNEADRDGGGAYVIGTAKVTNATVNANNADGDGGGVYVATGGSLAITGGFVSTNSAGGNGGGFYVDPTSGNTPITNANLSGNTAANSGGGGYVATGTVTLTGSTLNNNTATAGDGGGIWASSNVTVHSSNITNNKAQNGTNGKGGGFYTEGTNTVVVLDRTNDESANSVLTGNKAHMGGAVYTKASVSSGYAVYMNHVTVGNSVSGNANTASHDGGGVYALGPVLVSADATVEYNTADRDGGGVYVGTGGSLDLFGAVSHNDADRNGGGAYVSGAVTVTGATLNENSTDQDGGGVYVANGGTLTLDGSRVSTNHAGGNGGGFYVNPDSSKGTRTTTTTINSDADDTSITGNTANKGAGAFVASGNLEVLSTNSHTTSITSNTANRDGGGVYVNGGTVTLQLADLSSNTATSGNGGGVWASSTVTVNGSSVNGNHANSGNGGGIYSDGANVTVQKESSTSTISQLNENSARNGGAVYASGGGSVEVDDATLGAESHGNTASNNGGALYAAGGTVILNGASMGYNSCTTGHGGAVYSTGGTVNVNGGEFVGNNADNGNGGAIYVGSVPGMSALVALNERIVGEDHFTPQFKKNHSINGGAIYTEGGTCNVYKGTFGGDHANRNYATVSGGAIFANGGTLNYSDGTVSYNVAGESGGAFHVSETGTLNLLSNVSLEHNHVPAGKLGGAVYLAGVVQIGNSSAPKTIRAYDNFADGNMNTDPGDVSITKNNRNNVYLADPRVSTDHKSVITLMQNGLVGYSSAKGDRFTGSRVGFSTPRNFVPVVYCAEASGSQEYLHSFLAEGAMEGTVFEDSEKYYTFCSDSPYDPNHIYLWGTGWVQKITNWPPPDSEEFPATGWSIDGTTIHISSEQALGWAISYINGLNAAYNTSEPNNGAHLNYNIELEADLDMGRYFWTPIAAKAHDQSTDLTYTGTFNGNGHTISNLYCYYIASLSGNGQGFFGWLGNGAKVKDLKIENMRLAVTNDNPTVNQYVGAIAEKATGNVQITDCVVHGYMVTANGNTVMGGLVGQMEASGDNSPLIRSCFVSDSLQGYQMGGLVGQIEAGTVENSHASPKFSLGSCINISLADAGGNGWEGSYLTVNFTDTEHARSVDVTLTSGWSKTVSVETFVGEHFTLTWNSAVGSHDRECSFIVRYDNGVLAYSSSNPTDGPLASGLTSTIIPFYITLTDSGNDGWEGSYLNVSYNNGTAQSDDLTMVAADGASKTVVINTTGNDGVTLTWNHVGTHDSECGIEVKEADGNSLYSVDLATNSVVAGPYTSDLSALNLVLTDMHGNGWDGSKVTASYTGGIPQDYTMSPSDGTYKTVVFPFPSDKTVSLTWTSGSGTTHDEECFVVAKETNGSVLYTSSTIAASGVPGTTYQTPQVDRYVGGLVGINKGTVENCYVSERPGSSHGSNFGWLAGSNAGTLKYCYAPNDTDPYVKAGTDPAASCGRFTASVLPGGKYGFGHCDQQISGTTTTYNAYLDNGGLTYDNGTHKSSVHGLVTTLNAWVAAKNGGGGSKPTRPTYASWTRTMGLINGDYPVLVSTLEDDYVCVGSRDGLTLDYADDVNTLFTDYATTGGSIYLYKLNPTDLNANGDNIRIAIPEDIGVKQTGRINNARVAITFDNSKGDASLWGQPYDWHMFSSAINGAPLGLKYNRYSAVEGDYDIWANYTSGSNYLENGIPASVYTNPEKMDPPQTEWNTVADSIGYFPTDTPYGPWRGNSYTGSFDFYTYYEPMAHWINFKREGSSAKGTKPAFYDHWRDDYNVNIPYKNEMNLENGKGYLMAVSATSMLMADGQLNNGNVVYHASRQAGFYYEGSPRGMNLIGNPYQSYVDFDAFATENTGFIEGDIYYVLDADASGYLARVKGQTTPPTPTAGSEIQAYTAPQFLHPHQGFFVMVTEDNAPLTFTNDMRYTTKDTYLRDGEPQYALVNLACTDSEGHNDFATVELDRPIAGGGQKIMDLHTGKCSLWIHLDDNDYHVAFAPVGTNTVPVRFQAYENGVFTMHWQTANADFSYLHLIDNKTGADVDCLATDKYVFEGMTTDYASRFRLVFEFNEEEELNESDTFAFMMGDELIVNGEGTLQMFDVNGRLLMEKTLYGAQTSTTLPRLAPSVYVLRLTGNNQTKIQKLIIR